MTTIGHIVKKEFIQFRRDKKMLVISIVAPIVQLILLGYAVNLDVTSIPLGACDYDRSQASREYTESFTSSGYFEIVKNYDSMNDIDADVDNGTISAAIIIPANFGNEIQSGSPCEVQAVIDGADSNTATFASNYISMISGQYSRKVLTEKSVRIFGKTAVQEPIDTSIRIWYNPDLKSRNFMIPGVLGLLLMIITMILTSLAIVKEKEIGTMEQINVTPVKPYELLIGKMVPFIGMGIFYIVMVLSIIRFWFDIHIQGSIFLLFFLCFVFLLTTLGLGLFISTISQTQQQAMMTAVFFVMMPMIFLSGFVFPIDNMPHIIQYITYFMPLRYFFSIIRGIMLKGNGIIELWDSALPMLILGLGIFYISMKRFKKTVEG